MKRPFRSSERDKGANPLAWVHFLKMQAKFRPVNSEPSLIPRDKFTVKAAQPLSSALSQSSALTPAHYGASGRDKRANPMVRVHSLKMQAKFKGADGEAGYSDGNSRVCPPWVQIIIGEYGGIVSPASTMAKARGL